MSSVPGKYLNQENILRKVFDNTNDALRINTSHVPMEIVIDASNDSVAIADATSGDKLTVRADGTIVVGLDATSLAALENINVNVDNLNLDIRDLAFAQDKVDVTGSVVDLSPATIASIVGTSQVDVFSYNEVLSVASATNTTLLTYTATAASRLKKITVNGTNIAQYTVKVNGVTIDKVNTYFGGNLSYLFNFEIGYALSNADVVTVIVNHSRPNVGDFNAKCIIGV